MTRVRAIRRRQGGLTLIELMISLVIGLLVLGALLVVYLGSRAAYRTSDSLARVQESGRFAIEFIAQDGRMSGFMGCLSRNLTTDSVINLTANPSVPFSNSADGIRGFDGSDATNIALWSNPTAGSPTEIERVGNSDVLTIRRAGGVSIGLRADPASTTTWTEGVGGTVTLQHNAIGLRNSDTVALGSCVKGLLIFRVTNNPMQTGIGDFPTVLEYKGAGAGGDGSAGNVTTVPDPSRVLFGSDARAEVIRFADVSYFIGQSAAEQRPSLYRASGNNVEELVDNVEDMDIVYGVADSPLDQPAVIDVYRRAHEISTDCSQPISWCRVVSARISLLVASPVDPESNDPARTSVTSNLQTYVFREATGDGVADTQTAPDRRLRHVFTSTISLRNRVL